MLTLTERLSPSTLLACALAALALIVPPSLSSAEKPAAETPAQKKAKIERDRIATAVALNYCKASFHRIRKNPSKQVMHQEQTQILNNLNLSGIADREVIQLYTAVVDEIHLIQIAEKERQAFEARHRREFHRRLFANALLFGSEVATAQFVGAVRTGANSWWDYRATEQQKEADLFKVEKIRMKTVVSKSSTFLDTLWQMARKKNIPDSWLIRGSDLDRLEVAMRLPHPRQRLRVLKRMERFMTHFPPYWYYVARTQQQLGQLFAALKTYDQMAAVAEGHFRNDELLAAGMANQAMIQAHLGQPTAPLTARKALGYSSTCWEANLICARVLAESGQVAQSEDAILTNLDTNLERPRSLVHLLSLYYRTGDLEKIRTRLADPKVCRDLPVPVLLRCASRLDPDKVPATVNRQLAGSLRVMPRRVFGADDVVVVAGNGWQLGEAKLVLALNGKPTTIRPRLFKRDGQLVATFSRVAEFGNPLTVASGSPTAALTLQYPDTPQIRLVLGDGKPTVAKDGVRAKPGLAITTIDFDSLHLSLVAAAGR
ncbi:MAG: hypothetical protein VX877_06310 [Planctomycetota bacterium]|nr:hypothetical protein [Planctomycetota bacterium]